jgi:hypothetical protein
MLFLSVTGQVGRAADRREVFEMQAFALIVDLEFPKLSRRFVLTFSAILVGKFLSAIDKT